MFFIIEKALPQTCISCGKIGRILCFKCKKNLLKINIQTCIICENLSTKGETHKICKTKHTPDYTISIFKHTKTAKKIINRSKGYPYTFRNLQNILKNKIFTKTINNLPEIPDLLIPIPQDVGLFSKRTKSLPLLIAKEISKTKNIPILIVFKKNMFTFKKQKSKNKKERTINAKKSMFKTKNIKDIKNKSILLIDDVTTTGATLLHATKLLKENHAKTVTCFTITKDILES